MLSRRPKQPASPRPRRASSKPKAETTFVADAMLGSMARKLRAFGFDTIYYKDGNDSDLLKLAASEGRVLLTSDVALSELAGARKVKSLVISGSKEGARLSSLKAAAEARGVVLTKGPRRCSVCNGELHTAAKVELEGRIPAGVIGRHRLFHRCDRCGRIYWRGSHWKKLRWLERRLLQTRDDVDS